MFERRLGLYPAYLDKSSGELYVNTMFGDFPQRLGGDHGPGSTITGWQILSLTGSATVSASSTLAASPGAPGSGSGTAYSPEFAIDEDIRYAT